MRGRLKAGSSREPLTNPLSAILLTIRPPPQVQKTLKSEHWTHTSCAALVDLLFRKRPARIGSDARQSLPSSSRSPPSRPNPGQPRSIIRLTSPRSCLKLFETGQNRPESTCWWPIAGDFDRSAPSLRQNRPIRGEEFDTGVGPTWANFGSGSATSTEVGPTSARFGPDWSTLGRSCWAISGRIGPDVAQIPPNPGGGSDVG